MSEREEFQDRVMTCAVCRNEFTWNAGEQAFFREKGFTNEPKRCQDCRQANKRHRAAADASKGDAK